MVDIQSVTAEIRRGKKNKEIKKKKPQGKNIMSASAMQGGHLSYSYVITDKITSVRLTTTTTSI